MEWLNYHHLYYFWVVARTGSIARAKAELRLTQPTVSAQLQRLEAALGAPLFARENRRLVLTDAGRLVYEYAEEIFSLGREMMGAVRGGSRGRPERLAVGLADVIPKYVARRLLSPVFDLAPRVVLVCREDRTDKLVAELALHTLDLVISDTPLPPTVSLRAYSHLLGECGVVLCAAPELARKMAIKRRSSPPKHALTGAPFLLPGQGSQLRMSLEQWFRDQDLAVEVTAEMDDSALVKVFGARGAGVFAVPEVIEKEVCAQLGVKTVARVPEIRERFYAISPERRIKHPAISAIVTAAKTRVFDAEP